MPTIRFIHPDGSSREFDAPVGSSAMQVATGAGLHGVIGECGGSAMCATCHVYVDEAWIDRLPTPLPNELEMLECTASERLTTSRLSCQIKMSAGLDGIVLRVPATQQ
ncbi:MAG: 2Fe-2S iron-sulfur cluster binding domain-containing protein [Burkholderiaceae bacterium]|nr:2Fe-2S iron-sulfur cluster binding domain-containing protein [Burkholderiaceae bacterium]